MEGATSGNEVVENGGQKSQVSDGRCRGATFGNGRVGVDGKKS